MTHTLLRTDFRQTCPRLFFMLAMAVAALVIPATNVSAQEVVTLEGQVVCCVDCWAKADRTQIEFGTAEDLLKAKSCVEGGDPTLLAVREGDKFALHRLEQGKFRLPAKNWLNFVGKRVRVTGALRKRNDAGIFRVDALEVTAPSLAERESARALGQEVELTLRDLSGVEQRLSSLKGRVVVLNFWATYCIPCRKEMPDLAAIQNEYAALGVQVIGASTDETGDRAKVLEFIKETRINFPIWMGATTGDMIRFGLGGALPGSVVIDRDGRIAKVISGVVDQSDLKKQIDGMLASAEKGATTDAIHEREQVAAAHRTPSEASSVPS